MGHKYSCCGSKAKRDVYNVERKKSPTTTTVSSLDTLPPNVDLRACQSYHASRQDFVQNKAAHFYNDYKVTGDIGVGTYGEVKKAVHKLTGQERAVKIVGKDRVNSKDFGQLTDEVRTILGLDHPYIMRIFDVYEDDKKFYIICEYLCGGELFDRIIEQKGFSEADAARVMYQILSAVAYCHKLGVIHRDLKPENVLYTTKGGDTVKIVDFGLAQTFRPNQRFHGLIGTAYYIAPEVIDSDYNEKCDVWSCGVILYVMLSGQPPFGGTEDEVIYQEVKKGVYDFDHPVWEHISREAKKFIKRMMKLDVNKRYSAAAALEDPWLRKYTESNPKDRPIAQEALTRLSDFRSGKKMQEAVWVFLMNYFSTQEDLNKLRQLFEDLDTNKDGQLGKSELVEGYMKVMGMSDVQAEMEADKILATLDTDHDGKVNYSQFLNASGNRQIILTKERIESAFAYFDKNKDGYITADELKLLFNHEKIRQMPNEMWKMWIDEVDKNHDGKISLDEFKNMMLNPLYDIQNDRQSEPALGR